MSNAGRNLKEILIASGAELDPYQSVRSKRIMELLPTSNQLQMFKYLLYEEITARGTPLPGHNFQIDPESTVGHLVNLLPGDPFGQDGD